MTDDLERRLRGWRTPLERNDEEQFCLRQLLDEAADEIARLRAENEALREALGPFADVAYMLDEVGRAHKDDDDDDDLVNIVQACGYLLAEMTEDEFRRARAALKGPSHE